MDNIWECDYCILKFFIIALISGLHTHRRTKDDYDTRPITERLESFQCCNRSHGNMHSYMATDKIFLQNSDETSRSISKRIYKITSFSTYFPNHLANFEWFNQKMPQEGKCRVITQATGTQYVFHRRFLTGSESGLEVWQDIVDGYKVIAFLYDKNWVYLYAFRIYHIWKHIWTLYRSVCYLSWS